MLTKRALLAGMAATGFGLAAARPASAQTYPRRPVKMVVPLPPGSAPDVRHRLIAQALTQLWGQQVIVENRPGGGGIIGTRAVLGEQPDGYTLLAALASIYMILPAQQENLPFDVNRDMIPIGLTAYEGRVMACSPKLGVKSLAIRVGFHTGPVITRGADVFGDTVNVAARVVAGGEMARRIGGWEVISWALVFSAPTMLVLLLLFAGPINWDASPSAWACFFYVSVFSMFLGFFAWNKSLAMGGIARISQLQLLQPFVGLAAAWALLGEHVGWLEIAFALLVVALVALGWRMRVAREP